MARRGPISRGTLDDLMPRFAPLDDDHDQGRVRHVRGATLALAQDWLVRLPDGPLKELAIDALEEAARLARAACASAE